MVLFKNNFMSFIPHSINNIIFDISIENLLGFWFDHDITVDENGTNDGE